jgi:hypothetical protein
MAIFSRRTLQRLINENAAFLSNRQTRKHVESLNRMEKELSLAAEWEVVLINAFSKFRNVVHEKHFGGSTRADIYFEPKDDPTEAFLMDITTVSDRGLEEKNPQDALHKELMKIARERGLRPISFNVEVAAHSEPGYKGGSKVRLKIPGRARFKQVIFNKRFDEFLDKICQNPQAVHSHEIHSDDAELMIRYNPSQTFSMIGYSDYHQVYSLTENKLYEALQSKVSQLRRTNFNGPRGIIVCDNRYDLVLKISSSRLPPVVDEIVHRFLANEESINFAILACVEPDDVTAWEQGDDRCHLQFYLYEGKKFDEIKAYIRAIMQFLPKVVPKPVLDPRNAINWFKGPRPGEGKSLGGGYAMGNKVNFVVISSRSLLDLLSGKVS